MTINNTVHSHSSEKLPKVLIIEPLPAFSLIGEQPFTSNKFHFLKTYDSPLPLDQVLSTHSHSIEAILSIPGAPITANVLQLLPEVGLIVSASAGVNHIDFPECRCRGIRVVSAGNAYSDDVADLAVGLFIDVQRKVSASDRYVRQGSWAAKGNYPLESLCV